MDCDPPASNISLKFIGPARQQFHSLKEQADYFLKTYWQDWKNYDLPQSYIIPPIFEYKNSEVSDQAIENLRAAGTKDTHRVFTDRRGDAGEHSVYNAIEKLIQDSVNGPFIAVRGLDLSKNDVKDLLRLISQDEIEKLSCFREFDFVLIGPQIGFVRIEVKGSLFRREEYFRNGNPHFRGEFEKGLRQLASTDDFLHLLQKCSGLQFLTECIRKVLFTPYLEKARFRI